MQIKCTDKLLINMRYQFFHLFVNKLSNVLSELRGRDSADFKRHLLDLAERGNQFPSKDKKRK